MQDNTVVIDIPYLENFLFDKRQLTSPNTISVPFKDCKPHSGYNMMPTEQYAYIHPIPIPASEKLTSLPFGSMLTLDKHVPPVDQAAHVDQAKLFATIKTQPCGEELKPHLPFLPVLATAEQVPHIYHATELSGTLTGKPCGDVLKLYLTYHFLTVELIILQLYLIKLYCHIHLDLDKPAPLLFVVITRDY